MLRRLRIAACLICFAAFVTSGVMWVESYFRHNAINAKLSASRLLLVVSRQGELKLDSLPDESPHWVWASLPLDTPIMFNRGKALQPPNANHGFYLQFWNLLRWTLAFPHWFAVVVTGVLTIALRPRPRWRFTLRDIFVATTLFAIILGTITTLNVAYEKERNSQRLLEKSKNSAVDLHSPDPNEGTQKPQ
jgi:hypothetical protein